MKIYTEIVWSWDDERGELVKESSNSYDYEGPLTLCNDFSVESTINRKTDGVGDMFTYPKDTNPGLPHYIRFIARRSSTTDTTFTVGEVVLYMPPDALKTSYTQSIGDVDLGGAISLVGGGADVNTIQNAMEGALTSKSIGEAGTAIASAAGAVKRLGTDNAKAALLTGLQSKLGPLAAGISKATGKIINPHKAVVYQGPGGFRTFSYTFVLVPKSESEAEEIFNIVKFFKKRMHPGTSKAGINDVSSVTLTYPDEFEIQYNVNGKPADGSDFNKPLFKIHRCFMESFAADYTTSGLVSFMDDNQPVTTTISMSFKETQLLTKADIDEGY
jgi:hypothetical protein